MPELFKPLHFRRESDLHVFFISRMLFIKIKFGLWINNCYLMHHNRLVMGQTKTVLLPKQRRLLATLGENIRLARLRRDLSAEQVAERAGIGRATLTRLEGGAEGVSINAYIKVLSVLGLEGDLANVAHDDIMGRRLQDAKLLTKQRASKK